MPAAKKAATPRGSGGGRGGGRGGERGGGGGRGGRGGRGAPAGSRPRSARVARVLKGREPRLREGTKNALFLRGSKTSELCSGVLKDLFSLRKPHGKLLQRRNPVHPFDDAPSMEFLCEKNDCSLFTMASHSKKRPHNLVVGRTHDGHMLDMVELGIEDATTLDEMKQIFPATESKRLGSKPCLLFVGDPWENSEEHRSLRNLFVDLFRGEDVTGVNLASLDHVICFTAALDKIYMRTYSLHLKRPEGHTSAPPTTRLLLSAPVVDFRVRRSQWASRELWKQACKQPKELKQKKVKNVTKNALGETLGRLHVERQDFDQLQTRKVKALSAKKAVPVKRNASDEEAEGGSSEHEAKRGRVA